MKYLFILTDGSILDMYQAFKSLNQDIEIFAEYSYHPLMNNAEGLTKLEDFIAGRGYDCIVSYMFIPDISDFCQARSMLYASWTYDSPLQAVYKEQLDNSCNIVFLFDKAETDYVRSLGFSNVHYLPLAVNLARTGGIDITSEDEQIYSHDISFIGSTYSDNNYNEYISYLPEDLANELKLYLMKNTCSWQSVKEWPSVSDAVADFYINTLKVESDHLKYLSHNTYLGILILSRKLAEMDRLTALNALSEHFSVDLYTASSSPYLNGINVHPPVDYDITMNKIFYLSRINLNITLPSIRSGIPQRVLDIMGCGGFTLTNYQEEIGELFHIGQDIEVYHDLGELIEKASYYLSHEEARARIAINGYMTIRDHHTYDRRIRQMLDIIELYK